MKFAKVVPDIPPENSPPICYNYPDCEQDGADQEAKRNMAKQPDPHPAGKPGSGPDPEGEKSLAEQTEKKIRQQRKFSLAEAIGREAAGALSGASPVARALQVRLEIEHILEVRLSDPYGSLTQTILAQLELDPPLLAKYFDRPAGALAEYLTTVLGSESLFNNLVREADARWGRDYQERPFFENGENPPDPRDPYTRQSVRVQLEELRDSVLED